MHDGTRSIRTTPTSFLLIDSARIRRPPVTHAFWGPVIEATHTYNVEIYSNTNTDSRNSQTVLSSPDPKRAGRFSCPDESGDKNEAVDTYALALGRRTLRKAWTTPTPGRFLIESVQDAFLVIMN